MERRRDNYKLKKYHRVTENMNASKNLEKINLRVDDCQEEIVVDEIDITLGKAIEKDISRLKRSEWDKFGIVMYK